MKAHNHSADTVHEDMIAYRDAYERLVDERGELIAERNAAKALLESLEIHELCMADIEAQKDLITAAKRQRNLALACAAVIVIVLALTHLAR